jgi:hypothetical protein
MIEGVFMTGYHWRSWRHVIAAVLALASGSIPVFALADEGGVSFWLPGFFGSLSAVPTGPGFGLDTFFYDTNVNAGADVAIAREFQTGRLNPTLTLAASASIHNNTGLEWINPTYAFATPILGGQLSVGAATLVGYGSTTLQGTVTAAIPPFSVTRSDNITDTVFGNGDLYPQVSWKWHNGVNNVLVYATGDVPVGAYSSTSLANLGIGHGAADGGFGYTYLDQKTGREFTAVAGFTYNLVNTSTSYQNGVDFHLDWGASQYLSKQWFVGVVGYVYDQVSGDSGSGDHVGSFESRVIGLGPQIGYIFPLGKWDGLGEMQGYLNLKGYGEFDANDRPSGFNVWLTFAITPAAPQPAASTKPMYTR